MRGNVGNLTVNGRQVMRNGRQVGRYAGQGQTFDSSIAALDAGSLPFGQQPGSFDGNVLSPGETRSSTLYHQWSMHDVWVSLALAAVSGGLIGLSSIPICIAAKIKWYWPLVIWTGSTTVVWAVKAIDFFTDDKAVLHSQEQERRQEQPVPVVELPTTEIVIKSEDGKVQKRAKLKPPASNPDGLWQYAQALVNKSAAPSYEGGEHVLGAKAFGYIPGEFNGRSDAWRPTAITGGILEKDPHKSKGYRLTTEGKRAMMVVAKRRLGEWG